MSLHERWVGGGGGGHFLKSLIGTNVLQHLYTFLERKICLFLGMTTAHFRNVFADFSYSVSQEKVHANVSSHKKKLLYS